MPIIIGRNPGFPLICRRYLRKTHFPAEIMHTSSVPKKIVGAISPEIVEVSYRTEATANSVGSAIQPYFIAQTSIGPGCLSPMFEEVNWALNVSENAWCKSILGLTMRPVLPC
jgi:hypothetical protein